MAYKSEFEKLFKITGNGSLKADWKKLESVQNFLERCEILLLMNTGFQFNKFSFQKPYLHDVATTNENKIKLLQVYAVCFCCYAKACEALRVPTSETYNLFVRLDQIEWKQEEAANVKEDANVKEEK